MTSDAAPAGWYADPYDPSGLQMRYWDGSSWSDGTSPSPSEPHLDPGSASSLGSVETATQPARSPLASAGSIPSVANSSRARVLSMEPISRKSGSTRRLILFGSALAGLLLFGAGFLIGRSTTGSADPAAVATSAPATEPTTSTTADTTTSTTTTVTTVPPVTSPPPPAPLTTTPVIAMGNGAPPPAGFPRIVDVAALDRRVASQFTRTGVSQAVALAPGVYAAYNSNIPDLAIYYDGPNYGDCAARDAWFPNSGGACWSGVP